MERVTRDRLGRWLGPIAIAGVAALLPLVTDSRYRLWVATTVAIYLLVAFGLNLLLGYAGQVSLGHGALVMIGSYVTGILMVDHGWGFWWAALLAAVAAAVGGAVMALPALRVSSWYFALITLGFAQVTTGLVSELDQWTHGYAGIVGIGSPDFFGAPLDERELYWMLIAINVVVYVGIRNVVHSRFGRGLVAVRSGGPAATASGASPLQLKLIAFVLSAVCAGTAGAFLAAQKAVITPEDFNAELGILFVLVVIIGGAGRKAGPVAGVLVFLAVPALLDELEDLRLLVYGIGLLLLMRFIPFGIAGGFAELRARHKPLSSRLRSLLMTPASQSSEREDHQKQEAVTHNGAGGLARERQEPASLEVRGISKTFDGVRALDHVSFTIAAGHIHGIVGPNGSGKTTLLNVTSGVYRPNTGQILYDGGNLVGQPQHQVARAGIGRTFQHPASLAGLSLLENIQLGAYGAQRATVVGALTTSPRARREERDSHTRALELAEFVGLAHLGAVEASVLPHAQQRLGEIARAMLSRPRLLLLDEPAAGLSPAELDRLSELLAAIQAAGTTIVLVEHHLELVADLCDSVTVFDQGSVIADGPPDKIFAHESVVEAYMGSAPR